MPGDDAAYIWPPHAGKRIGETPLADAEFDRLMRVVDTGQTVISVERRPDRRLYVVTDRRQGVL